MSAATWKPDELDRLERLVLARVAIEQAGVERVDDADALALDLDGLIALDDGHLARVLPAVGSSSIASAPSSSCRKFAPRTRRISGSCSRVLTSDDLTLGSPPCRVI